MNPDTRPDDALPETNRLVDKIATSRGSIPPLVSPHAVMTQWKPTTRQPPKTKAELREMLAEAVRNTAKPEPKPPPKSKRDRG